MRGRKVPPELQINNAKLVADDIASGQERADRRWWQGTDLITRRESFSLLYSKEIVKSVWVTKEVNSKATHCDTDMLLISYRISPIWNGQARRDNMTPDFGGISMSYK